MAGLDGIETAKRIRKLLIDYGTLVTIEKLFPYLTLEKTKINFVLPY